MTLISHNTKNWKFKRAAFRIIYRPKTDRVTGKWKNKLYKQLHASILYIISKSSITWWLYSWGGGVQETYIYKHTKIFTYWTKHFHNKKKTTMPHPHKNSSSLLTLLHFPNSLLPTDFTKSLLYIWSSNNCFLTMLDAIYWPEHNLYKVSDIIEMSTNMIKTPP